MLKHKYALVLLALPILLLCSGCLPGANEAAALPTVDAPAGFLLGLWHGFIVIISFIVSLFSDGVNVYEVNNNGGWYNFGFLLGLMVALGGGGKSTNRKKRE